MKDLIAKLQLDANCALGAIWMHIDAQAARIAELEAQKAFGIGETYANALSRIAELEAQIAAASAPSDTDKVREAVEAMNRAKLLPIWDNDVPHKLHVELDVIFKALSSMAAQAPVREVPEGWEFNAADFSLKAAGKSNTGHASLIRDLAGRAAWHALDDDGKDSTPLYIYGDGETISAAIADAVKRIPASNKEQA